MGPISIHDLEPLLPFEADRCICHHFQNHDAGAGEGTTGRATRERPRIVRAAHLESHRGGLHASTRERNEVEPEEPPSRSFPERSVDAVPTGEADPVTRARRTRREDAREWTSVMAKYFDINSFLAEQESVPVVFNSGCTGLGKEMDKQNDGHDVRATPDATRTSGQPSAPPSTATTRRRDDRLDRRAYHRSPLSSASLSIRSCRVTRR